MLALLETARGPVQMVLFLDRPGRPYQAAYEMRLIDGVWHINGVYRQPVPSIGS